MIQINPTTLYTRADLAEMLAPVGVDADTFTARLKARKVFRGLWLGADLLTAYATAPVLNDPADAYGAKLPVQANRGNRNRRRAGNEAPGALDRLIVDLKRKQRDGDDRAIKPYQKRLTDEQLA